MSKDKKPQQIGIYIATSLVVGNMIGSGIFMLPASMSFFYRDKELVAFF